MYQVIKVTKEDVATHPLGENLAIGAPDGSDGHLVIIFDRDAAVEFANDVAEIVCGQRPIPEEAVDEGQS